MGNTIQRLLLLLLLLLLLVVVGFVSVLVSEHKKTHEMVIGVDQLCADNKGARDWGTLGVNAKHRCDSFFICVCKITHETFIVLQDLACC